MRGVVMAEGYELEDSVRSILNSPGGQMINDASKFLRRQAKYLVLIFISCVVIGFSLTKTVVSWLIADERLPDDVNIIVLLACDMESLHHPSRHPKALRRDSLGSGLSHASCFI